MAADVTGEEGALGDDGEVLRLGLFEGGVCQGARDAVPFDCGGHFGVRERDRLSIAPVRGDREMRPNSRLESVRGQVLLDGHGVAFLIHHRFLSRAVVKYIPLPTSGRGTGIGDYAFDAAASISSSAG